MDRRIARRGIQGTVAALAVALTAGACAHVGQDEFDTRLGELRADLTERMDEGDRETRRALDGRMDDLEARVDGLRADLQALEEEFDVTVTELEAALRFDVPVYFGFDEAVVQARGQEAIGRFGQVVQKYYPQAQITVEGFTDPSGSAEYNKRLGMRRAEAVRGHLVDQGLEGERVRAVSYGKDTSRLIAPDAGGPGTQGWQNRRVVLVIDHDGTLSPSALVTEDGET